MEKENPFWHILYRICEKDFFNEKTYGTTVYGRDSSGFCILFVKGRGAACKQRNKKKGVIVVDCGHGGMDPGVIGVNQLKEKDINLAISKKLGKLLEEEGYEVVMTRKEDVGLYDSESRNKKVQDMQKRCQMIKETKPLLTVSIHQNSYPDEQVCGPQVFYYTDSVNGEKLAKCIQEALNEELEVSRPRTEKANNTYYLLKEARGFSQL